MNVFSLFCLIFLLHNCAAIDIDDITLTNCTNGSLCDDPISNNTIDNEGTDLLDSENATTIDVANPRTTGKPLPATTVSSIGSINTVAPKTNPNAKDHQNTCTCDVTASLCDINCCCDPDCDQQSVLPNNRHHQPKIYDSRYCYTKNFIHRNNTQFILERLASNLFCIAYDNLPPIYGTKDSPDIGDREAFEDAKRASNPNKYSWDWNHLVIPPEFNVSSQYRSTDVLWKFQNNKVTLIDLPQAGFTGQCKLGKVLRYMGTSKWSCMQTDLSKDNEFLFEKAYNNFTVISSPHLFNLSYTIGNNYVNINYYYVSELPYMARPTLETCATLVEVKLCNYSLQTCPRTTCVPARTVYCADASSPCNSTESLEQSCSNGDCRNIVKRVRYTFSVDSACAVRNIEVQLELANASSGFFQHFEVAFEWSGAKSRRKLSASGGSGYVVGDPIVVVTPVRNNTKNAMTEHIEVGESDFYLTVPLRRRSGACDSRARHIIGFGEDVRLACSVEIATDNFSSDSCVNLQNQTLERLLGADFLRDVAELDKRNVFVSKTGDLSRNGSSDWSRIIVEGIARSVVTGQIDDNRIRCSGLLTSMSVNVLYTVLPKPETPERYEIAGVSVAFSDPSDVSWPECVGAKCGNVLKVKLLSLVSFTDISTPSMYFYAGGPNLDISLPYDFFYPFMSGAYDAKPSSLLVRSIGVILGFNLLKLV